MVGGIQSMRVRFLAPPLEKQKGGIENALTGLRDALTNAGVTVLDHGDANDKTCVHHFHGLWEPEHAAFSWRLRRRNLPYVVSPHGMLEPWAIRNRRLKKIMYMNLVERRHLTGASSLFVTSAMEAQHARHVLSHDNFIVLPIGCSDPKGADYRAARTRLGWAPDTRVLLYLSRIDKKKGLDMLLSAMTDDRFTWDNWHLVVVGDGDSGYQNDLLEYARRHAEKLPRISWQGAVWGSDRWQYFQASDVFVLPTHSENFGIAVLEALYAGTPVITTTTTPWSTYQHVEGIFISEPNPKDLRDILLAYHRTSRENWSPAQRTLLSDWANENFNWDKLVPRYVEAYERANESRRKN